MKNVNFALSGARSLGWKLVLPILILVIWSYATAVGIISPILLPAPRTVWDAMATQLADGTLLHDLGVSLVRILRGYSLGAIVGVTFGVLMGMSPRINRFFMLTLTGIRQVPIIAWVPLLVIWFGIGENSKIAVIFLASYFPVLVNTISGIAGTDKKLLEVGRMYHLSKWKMFTKIYLPAALPSIFVGLKIGLGISWMAVVGAEMIAASAGIGFRINDARSLLQYPVVFTGMIAIAAMGMLMDRLLTTITNRSMPWQNNKAS